MNRELRYAVNLPDGGECGDPRFLLELAILAERSGWDAVLLEDYVLYQGKVENPTCDVWPVLAAIAVQTTHILIGTAVAPLPRFRPWRLAREAAAIDQLSGGRFVLGAGLGDAGEAIAVDSSFTHFSEERDLRRRAEMTDEALTIIDGLWRGKPFNFRGRHYQIDEVTFQPTPVQQPRIPIWIGGGYPLRGPTERALRWDGSLLYKAPRHDPDDRGMTPDDVRDLRSRAEDRSFVIVVGGRARSDDLDVERRHIAAIAAAGADWWLEWISPADRGTMRAKVEAGPLRV
jgi:alkanesulfonate monooxygenase SsuD/methylene tetrahydromethanopterin reductase-like flavin-dependent oxidoreductase (luciferase family)